MIIPTKMGPMKNWSLFTITTRIPGCWSMGGKTLHLPTWTWSWWRFGINLLCTKETSSCTDLWKIYTYPQTYWLCHQHSDINLTYPSSLLIQLWRHQCGGMMHCFTSKSKVNQDRWSDGYPLSKGCSRIIYEYFTMIHSIQCCEETNHHTHTWNE